MKKYNFKEYLNHKDGRAIIQEKFSTSMPSWLRDVFGAESNKYKDFSVGGDGISVYDNMNDAAMSYYMDKVGSQNARNIKAFNTLAKDGGVIDRQNNFLIDYVKDYNLSNAIFVNVKENGKSNYSVDQLLNMFRGKLKNAAWFFQLNKDSGGDKKEGANFGVVLACKKSGSNYAVNGNTGFYKDNVETTLATELGYNEDSREKMFRWLIENSDNVAVASGISLDTDSIQKARDDIRNKVFVYYSKFNEEYTDIINLIDSLKSFASSLREKDVADISDIDIKELNKYSSEWESFITKLKGMVNDSVVSAGDISEKAEDHLNSIIDCASNVSKAFLGLNLPSARVLKIIGSTENTSEESEDGRLSQISKHLDVIIKSLMEVISELGKLKIYMGRFLSVIGSSLKENGIEDSQKDEEEEV